MYERSNRPTAANRAEETLCAFNGANTAAIVSIQADCGLPIEMRPSKYLNNLVEQNPRAVKRITRPDVRLQDLPLRSNLDHGD